MRKNSIVRLWTEQEIQILKNNSNKGYKTLPELLDRSLSSIVVKAKRLGIKITGTSRWSDEEIAFLRNNCDKEEEFVFRGLNRKKSNILLKIKELGLPRPIRKLFLWKEDDIKFLIDNFEKYGIKYCSQKIGAAGETIRKKAIKLGLKWIGTSAGMNKKGARICVKCLLEKPLSSFHADSRTGTGRVCQCKECVNKFNKEYREKNRIRLNKLKKVYIKHRRRTDPNFKLLSCLRAKFKQYYSGQSFSKQKEALVGCSIADCRKHLEIQWEDWMSWENHSTKAWQIDHIIPTNLLLNGYMHKSHILFNYRNLQPLKSVVNTRKLNNLDIAKYYLKKKIEKFGKDEIYEELLNIVNTELEKKGVTNSCSLLGTHRMEDMRQNQTSSGIPEPS